VGRSRIAVAVAAVVLACAVAVSAVLAGTHASRITTQELTITASDGTKLACGLVLPAGSPPSGGWPGLLLFHGLGQTHAAMEAMATTTFAPAGFASLACDARGTGTSGGTFGLDGPRDVQDARDLFAWLAGRSDVSDTAIGAFGLSLGGGEVWNAAAAGVPFKAIVPVTTWTDLSQALAPDDVPKTGLLGRLALLVPGLWDPSIVQARNDLLGGSVTAAVRSAAAARSAKPKLHSLTVPTLLLQGRDDFLFDVDQALTAYRRLAGPKRLYLGDLGHPPATNPAAEQPHYLGEAVAWFRHYLAGTGKVRSGVELAHDPWDGTTTFSRQLPRTRHQAVNLPGTTKLGATGSLTRSVLLPGGPLETFGDGSVQIRYSGNSGWTEIRAMVSVQGSTTPITVGAAPIGKGSGVATIPLLDEAVLLPRDKKVVVTVGSTSADGVYAAGSTSGSLTVTRVTLHLSLLDRTVSR
jgi:alpha-beta hydrolase superfamily lysophospholipase